LLSFLLNTIHISIDNLKTKVEEFMVGIAVTEEKLQKARSMEEEIRNDLSKAKTNMSNAKSVDIDIALLEIAYDKVSDLEKELRGNRSRLGALQRQLITYQTFLSNLKGYETELIEKVENSTINPKRKRVLLVAGIAGLIISLSLAFFIEYLGNVSEDRRRKNG
jgi:predicted  nucleic acid-binding Zn-ribbon protein